MFIKKEQRLRRARQTRLRIAQLSVARLTVFRSNLHIYASLISEDGSSVLASASTAEKEVRDQLGANGKGSNVAAAQLIGKRIAEKAKAAGVTAPSQGAGHLPDRTAAAAERRAGVPAWAVAVAVAAAAGAAAAQRS